MQRRNFIRTTGAAVITGAAATGSAGADDDTENKNGNESADEMQIILHGGAGGEPDDPEPRQAIMDEAADVGVAEETPLDAVVSALCVMEESPMFNAGVGGAIQSDGQVRTDAGIMTDELDIGAVASVPGVSEATRAARVIMDETPHVLVRGEFAAEIAAGFGIDTDVTLTTEDGLEAYEELDPPDGDAFDQLEWVNEVFGGTGTVGGVARSGNQLAAATSTGGLSYAVAGRIGDVPQAGSGYYCTDAGGVSVTGTGEDLIRTTLSQRTVGLLEDGESAQSAAETALNQFVDLTDSTAGIIVQDADGDTGITFNSDAMQTSESSS